VLSLARPCLIVAMWKNSQLGQQAVTLIELLCVMAIIGILVSLLLPALARGLRLARGLGDHLGGPGGVQMRIDEVSSNYARYRAANPRHGKLNRRAFINELHLSPAAETWLNLKSVDFHPFAAADPTQQVAIIVYPSPGGGSGVNTAIFRIGDLITR
jgi:prepilin-type N-terminal cleavage/methylation domain-containing protein